MPNDGNWCPGGVSSVGDDSSDDDDNVPMEDGCGPDTDYTDSSPGYAN